MHTCRQDQGAEQVLHLGRSEGWARCPGCSQLIELNMGCYHMTCRCRTAFCYLCSARWKTCSCPQWDEQRLLTAAERRVDAQLGGGEHHHRRHVRPGSVQLAPRSILIRRPTDQPVPAVQPVVPTPAPAAQPRVHSPKRRSSRVLDVSSPHGSRTLGERLTVRNVRSLATGTHTHCDDLINEAIERLRANHDCQHTRWKYRRGAGRCENCHDMLPLYLFRCVECEMWACKRCRWNRL
ncbi:hypothetical protein EDC04DRAFT_2695604 [Pisolithus marmoratus]|nr:hypothetical protein EDC04DRAFT_2695604 [Pisolithus marmoratus]